VRKRKVTYPVARTSRRPGGAAAAAPETVYVRTTVVAIDLNAKNGREGLKIGSRVRIGNTGLYSGEAAVIESLSGGVIPSAIVRTENGRSRRVRTIDLELISDEAPARLSTTPTEQPPA
jgi:hypothetical protein